ncbi:hypothetical protein LAWI1_G007319 [Lachnellula willkommii]|uniref:Uncharacterized protein n=1 Tax=Lachnellula willkommii TaxID=215461 RepID=A0A559M331_9HELO|nr:hypothetical protein LAWI1_G007319 [Lachnellula willkommii]
MTALVDHAPEVFLKHAANLTLFLYLQHRHHTVGANEAVIKVEGTART